MNSNPAVPGNRNLEGWAKGLFWGWNVVFLAFMFLGFAPTVLPSLVEGIRDGATPVIYLVFSLVLTAIPLVAVLIGALFLRKQPYRLFALGYVIEWPLLLILLFRFFLLREGNPAISVLLVWLAVAEAAFLWHLLDRRIDERRPVWIYLRLAGLTLLFSGTLYAAAWLAFYVPPVAMSIANTLIYSIRDLGEILHNTPLNRWYEVPLGILGYVLMLFSGTLIVVMPLAGPILAGRAWLHSLRSSLKAGGRPITLAAALLPLGLALAVLGASLAQPQQAAFKLLEKPPATPQQAQVLLQHEQQIRAGLLNAYLAPYRYLSSVGEVRHISSYYQSVMRVSPADAWRLEQAYELVIRPLLYVPINPENINTPDNPANQAFANEPQAAAALYQDFFDTTIVQGERQSIVDAVRSTPNSTEAELAWQAVDDREVHLNRQEVTLDEHGDWAEVQLHEVYENHTSQRQEVVYYFSLPESAVVTGLWLGTSADRSKAFAFQVAPRGAAQAVYRNEIIYNRDPALVEQIGPRQYRLRAFPVEPLEWAPGSEQPKHGPELHLWLAYRTLALNGAWPLPKLAEKRNVYWDGQTIRLIAGKPSPGSASAWLPDALPAGQAVTPRPHRVDFPGGQSVLARPAAEVKTPALPQGLRLAVVLDRSFSMGARTADVKQALASLRKAAGSGPEPDLFLTSSKYRGEGPAKVGLAGLAADQLVYIGGQNAAELLAQFEDLQAGKAYDAILVLTDGSGYEPGAGSIQVRVPDAPVWMVHLGGAFPLGYDDPTLQAIQASGGGVASTVEEALSRFAASRGAPGQLDVVDAYVWESLPTSAVGSRAAASPADEAGFSALAARRVILSEMAQNHGQLDQLPILDQLDRLAVEQGIVTPYSSMLVLVNPSQQQLLDQLSLRTDRFQREVEAPSETTRVSPFAVTGVPEPEEWLLLALAGLLLANAAWRRSSPTLQR